MNNRQRNRAGVLLAALCLLQPLSALAKPLDFKIKGGAGNQVSFNSDAPVEVIKGTTSKVTGNVRFDDSFQFDAKHPFNMNFAVDLASIDTGIPLRNEHMRDNFLETGKYPQATFKATSIKLGKKPDLSKPQKVNLSATGDFTVHGVTVKKTIPLVVDYQPAKGGAPATIRTEGKFPVPLAQHNIKRPEAVFVKLAETVYVDVDLVGVKP